MTTIDLTVYNALFNDDGSNAVGTLATKVALLLNPVLTPVQTAVTALDAVDALKAPLASPTFTGTPAAPTAAVGTNTTQLATTAFAASAGGTATSTVTTTGTITALALPTGTGALEILMNNATLSTIQGIAAGLSGQRLTLISMGAGQVDLAHQNAGASAANRLINCATSGNTSLAAGNGTAVLEYDATATRWRLVAHEQGAWITPTFAGGNFTGNASMTWTVDSGDVGTTAWWLKGRTVTVAFALTLTSIGGTPNVVLQIGSGAWGGFTATKNMYGTYLKSDNAGAQAAALWQSIGTQLSLSNGPASFTTNWSASTNLTNVLGNATFEVT